MEGAAAEEAETTAPEAMEVAAAEEAERTAQALAYTASPADFAFFDSIQWPTIGREASLYLWVKVPTGDSAESWALRLLDQGVVVSPGSMFAITDAGKEHLRIAMVPSMEECKKAIDIWKTLV